MKKRLFFIAAFVLTAAMSFSYLTSSAHSIDYLISNVSPSGAFNGGSGNFTITNPVAPGAQITFDLTFGVNTNGQTASYPRLVTFGTFGDSVPATLSSSSCNFINDTTTCPINVTVTAPNTPGAYNVKIKDLSGTGGGVGLTGGTVVVNFTVAPQNTGCQTTPVATGLTVDRVCAVLHQTNAVQLKATLKAGGNPVIGKTVKFTVDGNDAGSGTTDGLGVATVSYDVSTLSVGDHTIVASFDGEECLYLPSINSNTLGITYGLVSFQQPINADGSSIFKSVKTIPVKIIVKDANGVPVTDAEAHVFFQKYSNGLIGSESESVPVANTNGDSGNLMRLSDPLLGQYIFNWDTSTLDNSGTYRIRIDLGEGSCGESHTVLVSFSRKK